MTGFLAAMLLSASVLMAILVVVGGVLMGHGEREKRQRPDPQEVER